MIAELGHIALIIALCLALTQMAGTHDRLIFRSAQLDGFGIQPIFGSICFYGPSLCLFDRFILIDDFSVKYVAQNSNIDLPYYYKFSAVWGAHEGSLLLWTLILAGWSAAVALYSRRLPLVFSARVLSVMGGISVGFALFML